MGYGLHEFCFIPELLPVPIHRRKLWNEGSPEMQANSIKFLIPQCKTLEASCGTSVLRNKCPKLRTEINPTPSSSPKSRPHTHFYKAFANKIIYAIFRNAFDGRVMAAGKGRRIIVEPDELSQIVVCLFGIIEKAGRDHSGGIRRDPREKALRNC